MRSLAGALLGLFSSALGSMGQDQNQPLNLALPTDNDALFRGGGPEFYQYIERDFKGEKSTPWEGGQYGFVRNPVETSAGIVYTRFHEGIDIRALHRDARGEPLDEVHAIADGTVVHTSLTSGFSNYGRYVVVEHRWDGCSYFSLVRPFEFDCRHTGQASPSRRSAWDHGSYRGRSESSAGPLAPGIEFDVQPQIRRMVRRDVQE